MQQSPPSASSSRIPLPGSGQLPLLLAMLVLLVTLVATYTAWSSARRTAQAQLQETFDYRTRDMVYSISRRMAVYEQVLRGARGYLRGTVEIDRRDWEEYYRVLRLDQSFPGLEALGIASIIPPGRLAAHEAAVRREGFPDYAVQWTGPGPATSAITHIEPFGGRNLRAFGFDMFSEPVRRAAMERARDTGQAALSGKVVLVQEGAAAQQPGVLMYLPVYRAGQLTGTVDQRRAAIVGWVYAPFRMSDLMQGLGGAHSTDLDIEIHDGEAQGDATLLYRSGDASAAGRARPARLTASSQILPGGRTWTVTMRSSPALEASLDTTRPLLVAVTGVSLSILLSFVVWLLASERRRALQLAQAMTLELRQSHDQVASERQRIGVILENAPDAFLALDRQGRITDWNAQATRLFGWSAHEAIGRDAAQLLPEQRRAHFCTGFAAFAAGGRCAMLGAPTELEVLDRHGRAIPVELTVAGLPIGDGFGATAFVRDITQRKEAEAREQRRQQRLDEARQALLRSQKLEAVGKLTGGVAHDFNNILHIISANVQLMLRADNTDNPKRKRLLSILDAVERGSKLAGQLLAFARRQPLHPTVVNVAELLERMDSLVLRAAGDSITVERTAPPDLWPTLVDPNQLENVLLNLVINARDAIGKGTDGNGRITLALGNATVGEGEGGEGGDLAPGDYVTVAVTDTGHGMPPDVAERAFEPFFTTKPEGKGTGLGLSMAHGFARQSGGDIRLESEPGTGTTVTIYLPRHLATAQVTAGHGAATPHS
ncbi:CHASE domain-containing protein [Massilia consociata]